MDRFLDFIKVFNIQTILSLAVIVWYFTRSMQDKMEKIEQELKDLVKVQSARSDQLYQMFVDLLKSKK